MAKAPKPAPVVETSPAPAPSLAPDEKATVEAHLQEKWNVGPPKAFDLLSDDPVEAVKVAAREGFENWAKAEGESDGEESTKEDPLYRGIEDFDQLSLLEKFGLLSLTQTILHDPHQPTWAKVMPHARHHRQVKALDNAIRSALGSATVDHL